MKINQFVDEFQIKMYDLVRPRYNKDISKFILSFVKNKNNLLDIACGCGQLLFNFTDNFNQIVGIDVSEEQIKKAREYITNNNIKDNIFLCVDDVYNLNKHIDLNDKEKFNLIMLGQAYHWFQEEKLINYIKNDLLEENGVLALVGYTKQHLKENDPLYEPMQKMIELINPYFECDVYYNDSGYKRSMDFFSKNFSFVERKDFIEEVKCEFKTIPNIINSWSGYTNFKKRHSKDLDFKEKDPLENFIKEASSLGYSDDTMIDYSTFYFVIVMSNQKH